MLAGGGDGFDAGFQSMADAEIADPRRHAPMGMTVRRALGGTSLLWGGRCVAFDEGDFARGWPIATAAIAPWYARAIRYLDAGDPVFSAPLAATDPECRFDELERWSEGRDLRRIHAAALEGDPGLHICLGTVCTGLDIDPESGRVTGISVTTPWGERAVLKARAIVLACGGLETTRLLLTAQTAHPGLFGGADGPLGRYYMGHLEGRIAEIVAFDRPGADRDFDFFVDASGRYVRRRITIAPEARQRHGLLNLAAWPDNPALGDPGHRSAILSLAYLSLAAPGLGSLLAPEAIRRKHLDGGVAHLGSHLGNIVRGAPEAVREAVRYLYRRLCCSPAPAGVLRRTRGAPLRAGLARRAGAEPGLRGPPRRRAGRARQAPPRDRICDTARSTRGRSSRAMRLSTAVSGGSGLGRLDHTVPEPERLARVMDQATDGYHQIGTARMADRPRDGIVDRDCRVHGTPNLFIASSAVFPSSGEANPTLLLAALSARLAAHLADHHFQSLPTESPARLVREPELVVPS